MPYSRSQISRVLAAKVLPDEAFIDALLAATASRDARTREVHRERAETLLAAARAPKETPPQLSPEVAVEVAAAQARHLQTYERLAHTLDQRNELGEALTRSEKIVFVLSGMVQFQNQRIDALTRERDALLGDRAESAAGVQKRLDAARDQEVRIRAELQHARQRRQRAEALLRRSQAEIERLRAELRRLGSDGEPDEGSADGRRFSPVPLPPAASLDDSAVVADMARALDQAAAIGRADHELLDEADQHLAHAPIPRREILEGLLEQLSASAIAWAAALSLPYPDLPPGGDVRLLLDDLHGRTEGAPSHLTARFVEFGAAIAGGELGARLQAWNDRLVEEGLVPAALLGRMRLAAGHGTAPEPRMSVVGRLRLRPRPVAQGVTAAVLSLAVGLALSTVVAPADDGRGGGPAAQPDASVAPSASSSASTGPLSATPLTVTLPMTLWTPADSVSQRRADLRRQIPRIEAALGGRQPLVVLIFTSSPGAVLSSAYAMSEHLARLLPEEVASMRETQFRAYWQGGASDSVELQIYVAAGAGAPPSASGASPGT